MKANNLEFNGSWAIVLGGSSGFGLATVEKLAANGMNISALYRETTISEKKLKVHFEALSKSHDVIIDAHNINALDETARKQFIKSLQKKLHEKNKVRLLLHSIARGNLKPLISNDKHLSKNHDLLSVEDIQLTTYAMSTSLLDWTRALMEAELFEKDARIIGLTSEGAHKFWDGYAAVSIAKSSLESLAAYMAVELGCYGLRTNLIQAGITETPSLNRIPGSEKLLAIAKKRNPLGRVTLTSDVADVIFLLCKKEAAWINGSLIHVDGGEHCR